MDRRLSRIPLKLIEKYKGQGKGNKVFPIPSNRKTNEYLKEISAVCGFPKELTFHMARHTFATTVTLGNGVPIESVSKMLGRHPEPTEPSVEAKRTAESMLGL